MGSRILPRSRMKAGLTPFNQARLAPSTRMLPNVTPGGWRGTARRID